MTTEIIFPSIEPDLYPVLAGPGTFYPTEAGIPVFCGPPAWRPLPPPNRFVVAEDWLGYFQDRAAQHRAEQAAVPGRPPPEHTTADPWPDGVEAPKGSLRLKIAAEKAGWDARIGYSRAWRDSVGAGVYVLHHHVRVQARRTVDGVTREVWAMWIAKVEPDGGKPTWKALSGQVYGWPANVTAVTAALSD